MENETKKECRYKNTAYMANIYEKKKKRQTFSTWENVKTM